jgi:hypothetical protein
MDFSNYSIKRSEPIMLLIPTINKGLKHPEANAKHSKILYIGALFSQGTYWPRG